MTILGVGGGGLKYLRDDYFRGWGRSCEVLTMTILGVGGGRRCEVLTG